MFRRHVFNLLSILIIVDRTKDNLQRARGQISIKLKTFQKLARQLSSYYNFKNFPTMNKIFYFSRETEQELFYRTRLQLCPDLIHSNEFSLYNDGSVLVGGKVMSGHNYCISSALLWFCNSVYNRYYTSHSIVISLYSCMLLNL